MDEQKRGEFQTCKKSAKMNDLAFLTRNGYRSHLSVFQILHDLPLHVALRLEAKFLTQREKKRSVYMYVACHFLPAIFALFGKNFTWGYHVD